MSNNTGDYYASRLSGDLLLEYQRARNIDDLSAEIALLRALINVIIVKNLENIKVLFHAFGTLERLCRTNKKYFKAREDEKNFYVDIAARAFAKVAEHVPLETQMLDPFADTAH
jgi:hypothetical protein